MIPHEFYTPREMSLTEVEKFRDRTARLVIYSHRQKKCAGPCNRNRSAGQFVGGDTLCIQCRLRSN